MKRNKKFIIIVGLLSSLAVASGYFFGTGHKPHATQVHAPLLTNNIPGTGPRHGLHYSIFSQSQFFDKAFVDASATPIAPTGDVSAVVVNHHLLAPAFIAETLGVVASEQPTTVILVSPNHFNAGSANLISSLYDWQTPYGVLPANQSVIKHLQAEHVSVEEKPFETEHGISGIVAFIKKVMPNASVIPIILKDKTTKAEIDDLNNAIGVFTSGRVIMVSSVDFSHYLPGAVADFHDLLSKQVLNSLDDTAIPRLEVDSQPAIRLLLNYVKSRHTEKFTISNHSNSSIVSGDLQQTRGTSYITGYYGPGDRVMDNRRSLFIPGDIRSSKKLLLLLDHSKQNYIFGSSLRMFRGSTQTLTRVLGTVVDQEVIDDLLRNGVTDIERTNSTTITVVPGEHNQDFNIVKMQAIHDSLPGMIEQIKALRPGSLIISMDWQTVAANEKKRIAHALIDAGAIAVVGRSQEIQPLEKYNNRLIAYGLGQMIPAQLGQEQISVALGISVTPAMITYDLFPMRYHAQSVSFLKLADSDIVKAKLNFQELHIETSN